MTPETAPEAITQAGEDDGINLAFEHPDRCYVEACADSLNIPDWQPNRQVWNDLCEVALRLTATTPRLTSHSAGEGLREAIEALEPFADALGDDDADEPDHTEATVVCGRSTDYSLDLGDFRAARRAFAILDNLPPSDAGSTTRSGGEGVNCFGIPDTYRGWRIKQGPDDRFYVDAPAEAATWPELRDEIDAWANDRSLSAPSAERIARILEPWAWEVQSANATCARDEAREKAEEIVRALATTPSPDASPDSGEAETVVLTRTQGAKLMAICALMKDGDLDVRGHEEEDVENAREAIFDVGEECALQLGGLSA